MVDENCGGRLSRWMTVAVMVVVVVITVMVIVLMIVAVDDRCSDGCHSVSQKTYVDCSNPFIV